MSGNDSVAEAVGSRRHLRLRPTTGRSAQCSWMSATGRQASDAISGSWRWSQCLLSAVHLRQLPAMSRHRRGIETALRATDFYLLLLPMQGQQAPSEFLTDFTKSKTTARTGISQPYDLL